MQKRIPIGKIAEWLGVDLHKSTAIRWTIKGIVINGERVKLPATRLGNRIFVDENDLHKFVERMNERTDSRQTSMQRAVAATKKEALRRGESSKLLDDLGI